MVDEGTPHLKVVLWTPRTHAVTHACMHTCTHTHTHNDNFTSKNLNLMQSLYGCDVSTREDYSDTGSVLQKVFISWLTTTLGSQDPSRAHSLSQGEILSTKHIFWVDILQVQVHLARYGTTESKQEVSTLRDFSRTMDFVKSVMLQWISVHIVTKQPPDYNGSQALLFISSYGIKGAGPM